MKTIRPLEEHLTPSEAERLGVVKLNVPYMKQTYPDGCGQTNLAMLLAYRGYPVTGEELYELKPGSTYVRDVLESFRIWRQREGVKDLDATAHIVTYKGLDDFFPMVTYDYKIPPSQWPEDITAEEFIKAVARNPKEYFTRGSEEVQRHAELWLQLFDSGIHVNFGGVSTADLIDNGTPYMIDSKWHFHWFTVVGYYGSKFDPTPIVHNSALEEGGPFQVAYSLLEYSTRGTSHLVINRRDIS